MTAATDMSSVEGKIRFALRGVIDPEIGLSVVDVGLVYDVCVGDEGDVVITMTTTSRGCPATHYLVEAVRQRAMDAASCRGVEVKLTYEPPWSPDMMTP